MELKLLNDQGQSSATVAVADEIFGRDFNEALVHQIVVAYQANARMGNRAQRRSSTPPRSPGARRAPAAPVPG